MVSKKSESNVVVLDCITRLDVPAERILNCALDANMKTVVIVGRDADGDFYFASSVADGGTVLWELELAKKKLLAVEDNTWLSS